MHDLCSRGARLTDIRVVGLLFTASQMARILELPSERLDERASVINHFSWFGSVTDRETGEDLYPQLGERERAGSAGPLRPNDRQAIPGWVPLLGDGS